MKLILLYGIFFLSGMSSLIAEITWNRMLVLVIGNTVMATSLLLVAFMGGLGLGSRWGSYFFSRRVPTLLPYCILEVCIGIFILFSPLFFQPVSHLFSSLVPFFSNTAILYIVRFLVAFFCLFFPAFMMGATFPAIVAGSALKDTDKRVVRTGYLYSINTISAAIGCLAAGYFLLPRFGVRISLSAAFLFNIIAAAGAFILHILTRNPKSEITESHRQTSLSMPPNSQLPTRNSQLATPAFLRLIIMATFVIGFIALSYEVLLTRLVILFFGNQLIVFTLVLTAFLIGTGTSAFIGTFIHRYIVNTELLFCTIIFLAGASIVVPPFLLLNLTSSENIWLIQNQTLVIGLIMLIPIFFIGSLLPIAIRIFQTPHQFDTALNAGKLYAWNTFGGMLGAGITNYFLIPAIGTPGVLSIFSVVCMALGLSILWKLKKSVLRWSFAAGAAVIFLVFTISLPQKLDELYTLKLAEISGGDIEPELKLHHEGRVATITVIDFPWLGFRDMFLNGVEEASTRLGHVQLFKLLGLLPVFAHESDSPKETLMIAFGAGIAAGAALDSEQVSSLDVVDLNPDIEKINDFFKEINGDVFHNPKFNFIAEDGRNYLLMNPKKYSVIISDSTHPRAYDSWILYTKEFYLDIKKHLLPDGVFAQWIPLSDFSLELYKIMMNTFRGVFPNVTLWNIYGTDQAFLLATPNPFTLNMIRLQSQLDSASKSLGLKKYQMNKAVDISGFFVMDREMIDLFIGNENRVNTDNLPYNQKYSLKTFSPLRTQSFDQYQTNILSHVKNSSEKDLAAIHKRQALARAMYRYFFFSDDAALDEAIKIRPEDGNAMHYIKLEQKKVMMNQKKLQMDLVNLRNKINTLQDKIKKSPDDAESYIQLGKIYLDINMIDKAKDFLTKGIKYSPDSIQAYKYMGFIEANMQNWSRVADMFEYVLRREPDDKQIMESLIRVYAEQNRHEKAINLLIDKINSENKSEFEKLVSYQDDINISGSYFSLGDHKNAEKYLLNALSKYPGNTLALFYLANVYKQEKRIKEAKELLNHILKINPYSNQARQTLLELQKRNRQNN